MLGDTCLALPFSSTMTEDQVDYVCNQIQDVLDEMTIRDQFVVGL